MTIGERLKILREARHESLEDVSKVLGVTRQTLFKYEAGIITNIPSDRIEILARHYRVNPGFIMGWTQGESNSYHLDQIKKSFRGMNDTGKNKVVTYADDLDKSGQYRAETNIEMEDYLEAYANASAAAGGGSLNDGTYEIYHRLHANDVPDDYDAIVDVHGESMEPTIPSGAVAFIKFNVGQPPKDGEIYVFQRGEDTLIKRGYFKNNGWVLKSDNESFEDLSIEEHERNTVRVLGRLVGWTTPIN